MAPITYFGQMKIILVTGLDGSGKSTFFERLTPVLPTNCGVLRLPFFEMESLPENEQLRQCCGDINRINHLADESKQPLLKVIALFSSMLLFHPIIAAFEQEGKASIITERHPLIDSAIYAKAYQPYFQDLTAIQPKIPQLDTAFGNTITHVLTLSGNFIPDKSPVLQLMESIQRLFGEVYTTEAGQSFFGINFPERSYFLDAPENVLFERLRERAVKEHHETEAELGKMRKAYLQLFEGMKSGEIIDAGTFSALDDFFESTRFWY